MAKKPTASPFYTPGQYWEMPALDLGEPVKLADTSVFVSALANLARPKNQISPINYAGINKQAAAAAKSDILGQIKAYHDEQNRLLAQGASQAGLINRASGAAARATEPYANLIQGAYRTAAGDVSQFAGQASGALQGAAEADAAKLQAQLAGLGSQQQAPAAQGGQLGQATQALGGLLPSGTLSTQGANAYASALAIPAAFRGYGQQTGIGVLGAARQEADKYNLDINKVIATRGKLTQEYASAYGEQAQAAQKFLLEARAQQVEMIGKLATITDQSNQTKLAVQRAKIDVYKAQATAVTAHNGIIKAQNAYNLSVAKTMEAQRHNQITEEQAQTRIAQADAARTQAWNIHVDNYNQAQTRAQISQRNALTQQENSRGFWFYTDKKGKPYGLPQPTANHKIVWNKDGTFRSVLVHAPSTKGATAKAAAHHKAYASAAKMAEVLVQGKLPDSQTDRQGRDYVPGWDPTGGPNGTGGYTDANEDGTGGGRVFLAAGGKPPMGYQDAMRVLFQQTGGVLTEKELTSILAPLYKAPKTAAAYNLTAQDVANPATLAHYTGTHQFQGLNPPKYVSPTLTVVQPSGSRTRGSTWDPKLDPLEPGLQGGERAITKSGRVVDLTERVYMDGPKGTEGPAQDVQPYVPYTGGRSTGAFAPGTRWNPSDQVRTNWDPQSMTMKPITTPSGAQMTISGHLVRNGKYVAR